MSKIHRLLKISEGKVDSVRKKVELIVAELKDESRERVKNLLNEYTLQPESPIRDWRIEITNEVTDLARVVVQLDDLVTQSDDQSTMDRFLELLAKIYRIKEWERHLPYGALLQLELLTRAIEGELKNDVAKRAGESP